MELELQLLSQSSEEVLDETSSVEEVISISERRNTRKKDVSSVWSSLKPKSRSKTLTSNNEITILEESIVKENTVLLFYCTIY